MNLLYLHGLNSKLHHDRKEILELYPFKIIAPSIDYENRPNLLPELIDEFKEIDAVIGSSAGGLAGYYFAHLKNIPALLFNPALPFRDKIKGLPPISLQNNFLQVVLGAQDKEVNPTITLDIINKESNQNTPLEIHLIQNMGHPLPIEIFKQEVAFFWNKIR